MNVSIWGISSLILTGRNTALISFLGGTGIMLLFYLTNSIEIATVGLAYSLIVGLINIVILVGLVYNYYKDRNNRKAILQTSGIMLLNIPILLAYCWFALFLFDTLRITLRNTTNIQLNNVKVWGCEEQIISKLNPGQSETLWIHIPHDCGVSVDYNLGGQSIREDISGYASKGMGQIIYFDIGAKQKPIGKDL